MARDQVGPGLLAAIATGGVLGSLGRWTVGLALPHTPSQVPWGTFVVNVTGSAAMGVLVVWVLSMDRPHPWLRPFLGVGVLGGWTTFSSYAVEGRDLFASGSPWLGLGYVLGSLVVGLFAVGVGVTAGERLFGRRR
ncbi:CrcB family protein [Phycicoccus sp. SLBN-51]|jgi:CrcB protein|uniref:fluoride efflux transporter FluC n=1 Tax=Phycicoccus sp. SLBN-51 TaxID=2768447 RepID=UPI001154F6AB|nr:CrcB family protein [Phycicoccus sp. SLBN-51]TQJ49123.1 CrcB protein [Phycicoccus sp. SLBN-51]